MKAGYGLELVLGDHQKQVNIRLKELKDQHFVEKLWNGTDLLWKANSTRTEKEGLPLGWMTVPEKMLEKLPELESFRDELLKEGFRSFVLLGMGGSSMTPDRKSVV